MQGGYFLHTATLLTDGRVLLVGSQGRPELYDPDKGTWTQTPPPANRYAQHTATLLKNGKVLVAGGLGEARGIAAADVYDPGTNAWAPTGAMTQIRSQHSAAALADGRVLVAGGFSDAFGPKRTTTEIYDPQKGTWAPTASLAASYSPIAASMTSLADGRVLLAGGNSLPQQEGGGLGGDSQAQVYDPGQGTWTPTRNLTAGRSKHTATLLADGTVLVAGGTATVQLRDAPSPSPVTAELFHPDTGAWTPTAPLGRPRVFHTAVLLAGPASLCGTNCDKVLVVGGKTVSSKAEPLTPTSAELYQGPPSPASTAPAEPPGTDRPQEQSGPASGSSSSLGWYVLGGAALAVVAALVLLGLRRRGREPEAR